MSASGSSPPPACRRDDKPHGRAVHLTRTHQARPSTPATFATCCHPRCSIGCRARSPAATPGREEMRGDRFERRRRGQGPAADCTHSKPCTGLGGAFFLIMVRWRTSSVLGSTPRTSTASPTRSNATATGFCSRVFTDGEIAYCMRREAAGHPLRRPVRGEGSGDEGARHRPFRGVLWRDVEVIRRRRPAATAVSRRRGQRDSPHGRRARRS